MNLKIQRATQDDLPEISALAALIWRAHYPGIISHEQIDYMLNWMFDEEEMKRQMASGTVYERLHDGAKLVGFAAYGPSPVPGEAKLDKLYVLQEFRGKGLGKRLLQHVVTELRQGGITSLVLSVNKGNIGAIAMYQRFGFQVRESVVNDIGGGFVMDDYVMEIQL